MKRIAVLNWKTSSAFQKILAAGAVLPAYAAFALGDMLGGQLARPLVARVRGDGGGGGGGGGRGV